MQRAKAACFALVFTIVVVDGECSCGLSMRIFFYVFHLVCAGVTSGGAGVWRQGDDAVLGRLPLCSRLLLRRPQPPAPGFLSQGMCVRSFVGCCCCFLGGKGQLVAAETMVNSLIFELAAGWMHASVAPTRAQIPSLPFLQPPSLDPDSFNHTIPVPSPLLAARHHGLG